MVKRMKVLYESKDKIIISVSDAVAQNELDEHPKVLTITPEGLSLKVEKRYWRIIKKHVVEYAHKDKSRRLDWDDWLYMNDTLNKIWNGHDHQS